MSIIIIILFGFLFLSFFLVMFGLTARKKLQNIKLFPQVETLNQVCLRKKVQCNDDNDCLESCIEAQEGEEIVCRSVPDIDYLSPKQQKILGLQADQNNNIPPLKYCLPAKSKMDCSIRTGGIPIYTGWGGQNSMEFDCFCTYPLWASSRICDTDTGICQGNCLLNPGICEPGVFNWDLTKQAVEPEAAMCQCADGYNMVVDRYGLPRCVKKGSDNYYSDIDQITGISGGQPKIGLDNLEMKTVINTTCQTGVSNACCDNLTCPYPDSVCCGEGSGKCCPKDYPVCDLNNNLCLKSTIDCDVGETKCDKGCCDVKGATCCGDGKNCCPPTFPVCDPDKPYCNPLPIELVQTTGSMKANEYSSCPKGICPIAGGVCCGEPMGGKQVCCPSDYPICDFNLGMCRKP
jgi:hypothetical protein